MRAETVIAVIISDGATTGAAHGTGPRITTTAHGTPAPTGDDGECLGRRGPVTPRPRPVGSRAATLPQTYVNGPGP